MAEFANKLANHYYRKMVDEEIKYARAEAEFFKAELQKASIELKGARAEIVGLRRDLLAARVRSSSVSNRRVSESSPVMVASEPPKKKCETPVEELKSLVTRVVDITKCTREQALYALHHNDDDLKRAVGAIFENNLDNLNLTNRYEGNYLHDNRLNRLPEWYEEQEGQVEADCFASPDEGDQVVMLEDNVLAMLSAPVINLRSTLNEMTLNANAQEEAAVAWPNHIKRVLSSPSLTTGN